MLSLLINQALGVDNGIGKMTGRLKIIPVMTSTRVRMIKVRDGKAPTLKQRRT